MEVANGTLVHCGNYGSLRNNRLSIVLPLLFLQALSPLPAGSMATTLRRQVQENSSLCELHRSPLVVPLRKPAGAHEYVRAASF